MLESIIRLLIGVVGLIIVTGTLTSAIRTFVLARSSPDAITAFTFRIIRRLFNLQLRSAQTFRERDRVMEMYAPVALVTLPVVWLAFLTLGFAQIYLALGVGSIWDTIVISGSSLLTLGFRTSNNELIILIEIFEAIIGLLLIALLIAYLPQMYAAFSQRERSITKLEVRAGSPPSPVEMLVRAHRIRGLEALHDVWLEWEDWFTDLEETHTSLAALTFFRSSRPDRSWVTASGAVLDCAALYLSIIDRPNDSQAALCIRSGYLALRYISDFFNITYKPDPTPDDPISISRDEFDEVYDELAAAGVPLKPDRDQCWRDFCGWRVNYDTVLLRLAVLTMAPYAPWSSDRSIPDEESRQVARRMRLPRFRKR